MNPDNTTLPDQPNLTNLDSDAPFQRSPRKLLSLALIVIAIVAVAIFFVFRASSSGHLFDQALSNALQTSNFTQVTTSGPSNITILYDVSKPASSKVQVDGTLNNAGITSTFSGYGTFKDSYMKFNTLATKGKSVPPAALKKWFQVREDGFDASQGYFSSLFQNDPNHAFFGDLIFGSFSETERNKLLSFISNNKVYTYDKSNVRHQEYKGQPVAVYSLTENREALLKFNKLVAETMGLSKSDINQNLENLTFSGKAKLYISEKTKQFVHIEVSGSTVDYTDYGTTTLGSAPTPQTTFEQFQDLVVTKATSNQ